MLLNRLLLALFLLGPQQAWSGARVQGAKKSPPLAKSLSGQTAPPVSIRLQTSLAPLTLAPSLTAVSPRAPVSAIMPEQASALPQSALPKTLSSNDIDDSADSGAAAPKLEGRLGKSFKELDHAFAARRDPLAGPVAGKTLSPLAGRVLDNTYSQLAAMEKIVPEKDKALLMQVLQEAHPLLHQIDQLLTSGQIDPRPKIRTSSEDGRKAAARRELRVGVIPVAADPFQWGHLLIGLRAIAAYKLDKVVFVLAGDDPRKPNMTKAAVRHPMGKAVLDQFAPFFEYSSIAVGTNYDGEKNLFRLLTLNPKQKMKAFYFAGKDHYRLKDKNGNPDTLPKIEQNMKDPALKFNASKHSVEVVFIERDGGEAHVPTTITPHFLPGVPFEASSTMVRNGHYALMPYSAYEHVQRHSPGLYGIQPPP